MEFRPPIRDTSFRSLIDLATNGHYPLFHTEWIDEVLGKSTLKKLTGNEKAKAKSLIRRISECKSLNKKKEIIIDLSINDRKIFIRAFFSMVEGKIMDSSPSLH